MTQSNAHSGCSAKTVLLVDDPIVRRGVRALLESQGGLDVVMDAASADAAIAMATDLAPDIVVMDLGLPHLGSLEAIEELRRRVAGVEIVVFTLHGSDRLVAEAVEAGVRGYVCKAESDHLLPALRAVAGRNSYYSPVALAALDLLAQRGPPTL